MIKKIKGKFELYSKDGTKHLGSFTTKEEAQAREDEINKIKHAKEPTGNQLLVNISTLVDNSAIRTETREGVEFTVLPSKTLPKNVVMNSILYGEDEVEAAISTLDMSPVTIGHPVVNGKFAPASDPISQAAYGILGAHNRVKGKTDDGRWVVEKLIPTEQLQNTERGKKLAEAIKRKRPIHTSTGVYLTKVAEIGVNAMGQEYTARAKIDKFDHDAILLNEIGAATPEQGVGIFVNADGDQEVEVMYCNLYEMEDEVEAEYEMMPEEENRPIIAFLSKMLAKLTHKEKSDTMDGESGDMPLMPMNNSREESIVNEEQVKQFVADMLAANNEKQKQEIVDVVASGVVSALAANKAATEQAEKDGLIQQVVNAKLLTEDAAKECGISALRGLIANQKQPAFGLNANRAAGDNNADPFADYKFEG